MAGKRKRRIQVTDLRIQCVIDTISSRPFPLPNINAQEAPAAPPDTQHDGEDDDIDLGYYNEHLPKGPSRSGREKSEKGRSKGVSMMIQPCLGCAWLMFDSIISISRRQELAQDYRLLRKGVGFKTAV